jgi:hypothetical protein
VLEGPRKSISDFHMLSRTTPAVSTLLVSSSISFPLVRSAFEQSVQSGRLRTADDIHVISRELSIVSCRMVPMSGARGTIRTYTRS